MILCTSNKRHVSLRGDLPKLKASLTADRTRELAEEFLLGLRVIVSIIREELEVPALLAAAGDGLREAGEDETHQACLFASKRRMITRAKATPLVR